MSTITIEAGGKATDVPSIVTQLELLAAVCRDNGIEAEYASVSWRKGKLVANLFERDFKRIFAGQPVTGERRGNSIDVVGERYGVEWNSSLWSPLAGQSGTVEVQL